VFSWLGVRSLWRPRGKDALEEPEWGNYTPLAYLLLPLSARPEHQLGQCDSAGDAVPVAMSSLGLPLVVQRNLGGRTRKAAPLGKRGDGYAVALPGV
jgi:hypothetical protein